MRSKEDDDSWVPIDTDVEKQGGVYEPSATPYDATFSSGGNKTVGTVSSPDDDSKVKVGWPTTLPAPTSDGDELTYTNAVPGGGDLLVTSRADGFSYSIVLDHAPSDGAPQVEYRIPLAFDGVTTRRNDDGSITLLDTDGTTVGVMTPPIMWDDADKGPDGQRLSVESTIEGDGGHQTLVLRPDMDFLRSPSTTFPVTIDPQFALSAAGDTYTATTSSTGFPNAADLRVGSFTVGVTQYKTYLGFDLSSVFNTGGTITGASLQLSNFGTGDCNGTAIRMSRITSAFSIPTIAQSNLPTITSAGSTTNTTAYGKSACAGEGPATWDATQVINDAQATGNPTVGLALTSDNNVANYGYRQYRSLENGDVTKVPTLTVTWLPPPPTPVADNTLCAQPAADDVCVADPSQTSWSSSPSLQALTTDPLGLNLSYTFEVWSSDGTNPVGTSPVTSTTVSGVVSGLLVTFAPQLLDNGLYQYRVKVSNGLTSTVWSAWHVFVTTACTILQSLADTTDHDPTTGALVRVLNWDSGDQIVSQTVEPAGFDASTATDDQLEFYGLPVRPADPLDPTDQDSVDAWDTWHSEVDAPETSHIQALGPDSLCAAPADAAGAVSDQGTDPNDVTDPDESSDRTNAVTQHYDSWNWGGEVANQPVSYRYVTGEFKVPNYTQCGSNPDAHSSWVGIGGWGLTTNLLQNGVGTGLGGGTYGADVLQPFAWYESISHSLGAGLTMTSLPQSRFAVRSGDDMVVSTQYNPTAKKVTYYWHNKTSPRARALSITVTGKLDHVTGTTETDPGHISNYYTGATAEAVDERTALNGYYSYNRQHSVTNWISVKVSTSNASTAKAIRAVHHMQVRMTNKYNPNASNPTITPLDTPKIVTGHPDRFSMTWHACGAHQTIPSN